MEYEFQFRREAKKLFREQGNSIQAALWATYRKQEHRMEHWVTLLTIANSRCDAIPDTAARNRTVEETSCRRPDPGRHGEPKDPEKILEVNWHHKTVQHSLRTKEKETSQR